MPGYRSNTGASGVFVSPLNITIAAQTGTVVPGITLTEGAHTALTASTERFDVNINGARTVQWATGALTLQRFNVFQAPTIAFVGGSTVTDAATVAITGAVVKGTNATVTRSHGLLIQGGSASTASAASALTAVAPSGATTLHIQRWQSSLGTDVAAMLSTGAIALTPSTLADTVSAVKLTATLPTTTTAALKTIDLQLTTAGTSAFSQQGLNISLLAGYTGASSTVGMQAANAAAGTATNTFSSGDRNSGILSGATATTTGTNMGVFGYAQGGDISVGLLGRAFTAKNSATNIGVLGIGLNTGTSPTHIGGFFGLLSAEPTWASAALLADNGTTTSDVFGLRDGGALFFQALDGGTLVHGAGNAGASLTGKTFRGPNADGTTNNVAGVISTFAAGAGSGTGVAGTLAFQAYPTMGATGATLHTAVTLLTIGHSQSAHPTTTGALVDHPAATWTDEKTAGSGTAASAVMYGFQQPTLAARNTLVTTTVSATVGIAGPPIAGTNQTLTRNVALWLDTVKSTPAGGAVSQGMLFGSAPALGIYYGSSAPTLSAPQGSLYLRTDGSSAVTRAYINTDAGTTWTAISTVL